ncbi:polyketide cyclase [Nocardioides convexus]|uniref:SRPBCC family protein n=1 Tax=Nocardioides convexus TaxID=2712224 RepID=UPI0024188A90|nr:polyketide cyclase [Nocardioides convexus]
MRRVFEFVDRWEVPAPPEEVAAVLVDLERYPRWWPQVRAVAKARPGHRLGVLPLGAALHAGPGARRRVPHAAGRGGGPERGPGGLRPLHADRGGGRHPAGLRAAGERARVARRRVVRRPGVLTWNHARMMAGCRSGLGAAMAAAR